jgi:hypothetical protein
MSKLIVACIFTFLYDVTCMRGIGAFLILCLMLASKC